VSFVKKKILYLSIGGRSVLFKKNGPSEFFFGGREFIQQGHYFEIMEIDSNIYNVSVNTFVRTINFLSSKFFGFPFGYFWIMASQKNIMLQFNKFDQIVVTTARLGLSLLLIKKLFKICPHISYITMGLVNKNTNFLKIWIYRLLITDGVTLSALSESEALYVESKLNKKVEFIPFGVDFEYWHPLKTEKFNSDYVFSMGNDPRRDFSLLIDVWKINYPKLLIITSLPIRTSKKNVEVRAGSWKGQEFSDDELREIYRAAKLVIVPSIETQQPSGQSVTLQAMSCGKAVIYPNIKGIWDSKIMVDDENIFLYEPEDNESLTKKIDYALSSEKKLNSIGILARSTVEKYYGVKDMAEKILNPIK